MFDITRQERRVIVFLVSVALVGIGVDFLMKHNSRLKIISYLNPAEEMERININQADADALRSVPGVGEKLAERIIAYRRQRGGYTDLAELREIKGIGRSKYNTIRDYLVVK